MIQIIHNTISIQKVIFGDAEYQEYVNTDIIKCIFSLAEKFPNEILVWVHHEILPYVNFNKFLTAKKCEIHSFTNSLEVNIQPQIGYIDQRSSFLNIPKNVQYATWQLSSDVGFIHAETILVFKSISKIIGFDNFLTHLGKTALASGVFVYSSPDLIINKVVIVNKKKSSLSDLFLFARKNYTFKMYFLLFLFFIYFEKQFPFLPFFKNIFKIKNANFQNEISSLFTQNTTTINVSSENVNVIIPTLGRVNYLLDVLLDLNNQTLIPKKVIIVEQIDTEFPKTELEYITTRNWNFEIIHKLINKLGACNARNLALQGIKSDWIFFADDDIRIPVNTIEKSVEFLKNYTIGAVSLATYRGAEKVDKNAQPLFWSEFSSGCSIVDSKFVKNTFFNTDYEFGYGEDTDYGMQLRKKGCSVVYFNKFPILHLQAPIGGFRKKIKRVWDYEKIQPKPLPSEIKSILDNFNKYQFLGLKMTYIMKQIIKEKSFLIIKQFKLGEEYLANGIK